MNKKGNIAPAQLSLVATEPKSCYACDGKGYYQLSPSGQLVLCDCVNNLCKTCDATNSDKVLRRKYDGESNSLTPCKCFNLNSNFKRVSALYEKANIPLKYRLARLSGIETGHDKTSSLFAAVDAIGEFLSAPEISHRGFYLYGTTGSGKTHLACSILNELILKRGIEGRYCKVSRDFIEAIKATFNIKDRYGDPVDTGEKIIRELQTVPVLVLDDFGVQKESFWALEKFYDLLDDRYENRRLTIFTSNMKIEDWKEIFKNRIYSRLCEMTVPLYFEAVDYREFTKDIA